MSFDFKPLGDEKVKQDIESLQRNCQQMIQPFSPMDITYSGLTSKPNFFASSAGWVSNTGYKSFYFTASKAFHIYTVDEIPAYLSICLFSGGIVASGTYKGRWRNTESTLPTESSKLSVASGDVVVFTIYTADRNFKVYENYLMHLNNEFLLSEGHINQVADNVAKNIKLGVKYETGMFDQGATEQICVYTPTVSGYIKYILNHCVNVGTNADSWHIRGAYSVNDDYSNNITLTVDGEWEAAVMLDSRSDYSGGYAHGDEIVVSLSVFVDGVLTDPATITSLRTCKELRIVETSNLYDPADNVTVIAKHGKEYVFSANGLIVNQTITWQVAAALVDCYMAMFTPSKAVTNTFYTDIDYTQASIPESPNVTVAKATKAVIYSEASGFTAEFAIEQYPTGLTGGDVLNVRDNSGGNYNKMYYYVCSAGHTSSVGEVWRSRTVYRLNYSA